MVPETLVNIFKAVRRLPKSTLEGLQGLLLQLLCARRDPQGAPGGCLGLSGGAHRGPPRAFQIDPELNSGLSRGPPRALQIDPELDSALPPRGALGPLLGSSWAVLRPFNWVVFKRMLFETKKVQLN